MADTPALLAEHRLCTSEELPERGRGLVFDVLLWNRPERAFALRFEGQAVAYMNRCAHVPTELDWQPGEFLDQDKRWIICAVHGATYEPASGLCVAGPCRGARLMALRLAERDGQVYWYPSRDIRPAALDPLEGDAVNPLPSHPTP